MAGMSLYGGKDAGSVLVAIAEKGLAQSALSSWSAHCARKSLAPTLDAFRQYLRQKAEELEEVEVPSKVVNTPRVLTPFKSTPQAK